MLQAFTSPPISSKVPKQVCCPTSHNLAVPSRLQVTILRPLSIISESSTAEKDYKVRQTAFPILPYCFLLSKLLLYGVYGFC